MLSRDHGHKCFQWCLFGNTYAEPLVSSSSVALQGRTPKGAGPGCEHGLTLESVLWLLHCSDSASREVPFERARAETRRRTGVSFELPEPLASSGPVLNPAVTVEVVPTCALGGAGLKG